MSLPEALAIAAPYYNLAMVVVAVYLFVTLFRTKATNKNVYIAPWQWIFVALCIFIVEEVATILRASGVFNLPQYLNGYFELAIISIFVYALLLQHHHNEAARAPAHFLKKR